MISIEPIKGSFKEFKFDQFELVVIGGLTGAVSKIKGEWVNSIEHNNIYYKPNVRQYLR